MYDLIYAGREVEDLITQRFPSAKITDASDDIHRERFELELDISEEDFYIFAIREGFALCCFTFALMTRGLRKEDKDKIEGWAKRAKQEVETEKGKEAIQ